MTDEVVSVDQVIELLNELVEIDAPAIAALIANRVPCNQSLADHPTVQVGAQHGGFHVGVLGVLNGLFGTDERGRGLITAEFVDGNLISFRRSDRGVS